MKKLLTIFILIFCLQANAAKAEEITIVADIWCPYNCAPNSAKPGFMIEIAQKAFAKHNITVKYSNMPWSRAIEDTRKNQYSAIVGAAKQDAPDFIFPAIPQGRMTNAFYVKKGSDWKYGGVKSLEKISLGVIADYSYNEVIDAYIAKNKKNLKYIQSLSGDNAMEANVKKLLAGRVGAVIEGRYVMANYLAQNKLSDQVQEAGYLAYSENDNLYIAFSPKLAKAKQYADILAKEVAAMRKSGELKKILARYNLSDWQK